MSFLAFWLLVVRRIIRVILHPKLFFERRQNAPKQMQPNDLNQIKKVYLRNTKLIKQSLSSLDGVYDEKIIAHFLEQRQNMMGQLELNDFMAAVMIRQDPAYIKEMLRGYYLERKVIDLFETAGTITTFAANEYRRKVNLLESYAMGQTGNLPRVPFFRKI